MDIERSNLKNTCCDFLPVIIAPSPFWAETEIIFVTFPATHFISKAQHPDDIIVRRWKQDARTAGQGSSWAIAS
jgi:hypothetical protein